MQKAFGPIIHTFWTLRIRSKRLVLKLRLGPLMGFCKRCGVEVRDFQAPDDVWERVQRHPKGGQMLCYNCFSDLCLELGLQPNWRLVDIDKGSGPDCSA